MENMAFTQKSLRKWSVVAVMLALVSLVSCDEDFWIIRQTSLVGYWRTVEVEPISGYATYEVGDVFCFHSNGTFEVTGIGGFSEAGYWDMDASALYFDFDGDGRDDMRCRVLSAEGSYLALDVWDYSYESRYRLRLIRSY